MSHWSSRIFQHTVRTVIKMSSGQNINVIISNFIPSTRRSNRQPYIFLTLAKWLLIKLSHHSRRTHYDKVALFTNILPTSLCDIVWHKWYSSGNSLFITCTTCTIAGYSLRTPFLTFFLLPPPATAGDNGANQHQEHQSTNSCNHDNNPQFNFLAPCGYSRWNSCSGCWSR